MSALSALLQVKTDSESVDHIRKVKAGCVSLGHLLSPTYQTGEGFRLPRLFCSPHCPSSCLWARLPHSSYILISTRPAVCFHCTLMSLEILISLNKYEHSLVFMSISLPSLHSMRASLGRGGGITFGSVCPSRYRPFSGWGKLVFFFFFLSFLRQSLIL